MGPLEPLQRLPDFGAAGGPIHFIAGISASGITDGISLIAALAGSGTTVFVLFLPADAGMSGAELVSRLAARSPIPVVAISDGMPVLPRRIHLAPLHGLVEIRGGLFRLRTDGGNLGFDGFLQALARSAGPRAVAIIPDGTEDGPGPRMIRQEGGRVILGRLALSKLGFAMDDGRAPIADGTALAELPRQDWLPTPAEGESALRQEIEKLRLDVAMLQREASLRREEAGPEELPPGVETIAALRNILDSSGIAYLLLDSGLNIRFFTPSGRLPFRMIARDIGRPLADIASLVSDPDLLDDAQFVLATQEPASRELEGPDGNWLMRRIHPCLQRTEAAGVVVTYADIRETKAAAMRAELTRSLAGELIQSYHQPLVLLNASLQIVFANESFRRTFAGDDDGETAIRLLVGTALRTTPQLATFLTGRDDHAERIDDCVIQVSLPASGPRTLRLVVSRAPPGRTLFAVNDITERVIATEELRKAKAAAEGASRHKSRLLSSASQDLRQPLHEAALAQRALAGSEADAALAGQAKRLGIAISEMSGILDALQDASQLDMGLIEPAPSAFPIRTVLAGLNADFAEAALLRGLRWRVMGAESDWTVFSDSRLLGRALRHLVCALLRYTPVDRLLIGCRRRGNRLRLELWSRGLKIPVPLLRSGFEPRHEGRSRRESDDDVRLELDVARRLGELLNHPIRVEARSPSQTVFVMDLPMGLRPVASARAVSPRSGMYDVLVVEEDAKLTDALRLLLERNGYSTLVAADAAHALGLAIEHPPALIIVEYDLPGPMTGLDLARRIAGTRFPPPSAILLTREIPAAVLPDIDAANFEHLPRSTDLEELVERVRVLLPHPTESAALDDEAPLGHVFIVDDDPVRRNGLVEWLKGQGWVAEGFASGSDFLAADTTDRLGCVLADWSLREMSGAELLSELRPVAHRLPTVIVSDQGDMNLAINAISAGAIDVIKRPIHRDALVRVIEKAMALVMAGAQQQTSRTEHSARIASLTPRQKQILDRVLAGTPNKIIAADLDLSQRTVENHRATLMAKLGARSLPELIRIVMGAR